MGLIKFLQGDHRKIMQLPRCTTPHSPLLNEKGDMRRLLSYDGEKSTRPVDWGTPFLRRGLVPAALKRRTWTSSRPPPRQTDRRAGSPAGCQPRSGTPSSCSDGIGTSRHGAAKAQRSESGNKDALFWQALRYSCLGEPLRIYPRDPI